MLLPVIERFAEIGWQAFVEPGETYELFSVSGIFKRARVDTSASSGGAQHLVQRNALFDVCVSSGLAHLVVAYVRASESAAGSAYAHHEGAVVGKHYVLKEPIAVQQWLRRRVEMLEKTVHSDVAAFSHTQASGGSASSTPTDHHHHNRQHHQKKTAAESAAFESHVRELSGLRAVAMALVERLKEAAQQLEANAHALRVLPGAASQRPDEALKQTELARLTNEGIQNLLEMLFRVQAATLTCQCLQWFKDHHVVFDADQYHEFYYQARSARASLRQSFEGSYDVVLASVSNSDIGFPSLLIELVMQNAAVAQNLSLPPSSVTDMLGLLQPPAVHDDMVKLYAEEISHEPVESLFRVQTALLLYFALDVAYVSGTQNPTQKDRAWTGAELVHHFVDVTESFAAQMGVPDDMKATLLAIWLIENAVNVRLASNEEVAPIYHGAVTRLLESSAMHLQRKAGLEAELILYMVETLVHRGESSFAWKIWTAFEMDLAQLPPVATEYAVMVNLELGAWERALSMLRHQRRLDLLELVLKWLVRNNQMKELVHYTTLARDEEQRFDEFMMGGRVLGDSVLHDGSVRKADLLVMYYVLRNHFDKAWAVHHEHLALIRESTSGNTNVAHAVLHQPSFRIRSALLQNMKPEPTAALEAPYNFKRGFKVTRPVDMDVLMIGSGGVPLLQLPEASASEDDDRMSDHIPFLASAPSSSVEAPSISTASPLRRLDDSGSALDSSAATPSKNPFTYSPGIFSSRSSQPRSSSSSKKSVASSPFSGDATTPAAGTSDRKVPIGSIDASPDTRAGQSTTFRRHSLDVSSSKSVTQALNFGSSPAATSSANATPSSQKAADVPRGFVLQPVRPAFNSAFSAIASAAPAGSASTDDLALRPRSENGVDATPVDVQIGADADDRTPTSTIAAAASTASQDVALFATPKRFQFVREPPKTDSRVATKQQDAPRSPATQELEAMELEPIDEEFSTPAARAARGLSRKEPQSTPSRRNPRRTSRTVY